MAFQLQPGAEGSLSESVHFPPTSGFLEHQGYHVDPRVAMAPPHSSASRAPSRAPFLHSDGRGGPHYMHTAEFDYAMRRHSCGDHLGFHSGALIEHLLLQENQKALRMASLVQSQQASGCLSGCLSCGLSDKRLRFNVNDSEGPSRSVNLGAEGDPDECPEGWFRQPRPRQSSVGVSEGAQTRLSFSEEELGRSLCQGRRTSYPVSHPGVSCAQANHHVQDHQLHSVGAAESSVPMYGFMDADGRVRQRCSSLRQAHSGNGTEEDGWQRGAKSVPRGSSCLPSMASQERPASVSLPGVATRSSSVTVVGSPHRPVGDSVCPPQSTWTSSQSPLAMPENSMEPSYQDNVVQQVGTPRVVTQGPVSLTNWYIMKVQVAEVGRTLETKVALGGWVIQNQEHVKTSPVVNRLDFHRVVTEDGVEVSLEGSMDQETSTANGFSPGIVQCLAAGFPYLWKQFLRVRPVGESSNLAVSESLGGLHTNASKCLSEDESQGALIAKTILVDIPSSSRDCEGNSPAAPVNQEPSVIQTPVNITPVEAIEREAVEVEAEAVVTARAETAAAIVEGSPRNVVLQQTCDANPASLDPTPVPEAPAEHVTTDSLAVEGESVPTVDTTSVTIRRSRKNKKGSQQPVRSSRRLQQRQSRSGELNATQALVDSTGPTQVEQVTSAIEITIDKPGENEAVEIVPDIEQVPTGDEELTRTDNIIEEVLKDLQQVDMDTEAVDQGGNSGADSVDLAADQQPMEVEEVGQVQEHCEILCKDTDAVEIPELLKEKEVAEGELESEEAEETAPVTPPELLQSKTQSRVDSQARTERVSPEYGARMTRSLKRQLKLSPVTDAVADVSPPVTRSLKRLRRLSDAEAPGVGPVSNPETPLQDEGDAFFVRVRNQNISSSKAVSCSNCKQPCSPQDLLKYKSRVASFEATPEQSMERVQKVEQQDYAPLASSHHTSGIAAPLSEEKTETCSMQQRETHAKRMKKSAIRPAKRRMSRRLTQEDPCEEGSSEGSKPVPSRRNSRRTSILPPPLPPPRVQDKSKVPEAFGLKTSRSGRLLVPPLAYWRSQSIEYDKDGGIIAIFDGFQAKPSDTGCFNFTPPQEKHAKKIQEKLYKAAATVKKRK